MRIVKLKINNFLLPLFFSAWFTVIILPSANAQTTPQSEETNPPPEVQNQTTPTEEKPKTTIKKTVPTEQPKPAVKPDATQSPPENSTKKTEPPTEQSNSKTANTEAPKNEPEPTKELDLPEVSDDEAQKNSSSQLEIPEKSNKSIIKIIISCLLIGLGLIIIIKVIINNVKIPRNYEPHIKSKHSFKSNRRKNKYNLKYK